MGSHLYQKLKIFIMAAKESTGKYWVYFIVSTLVMIAMLIWMNEWFWVAMPFSFTSLVKALDVVDVDVKGA